MSMLHSNPYYYTHYTILQNQNTMTRSRDIQFPVCLVRALMTHHKFDLQYSSDVTLHSLASNLLTLIWSYSWRVLYYP